MVETNACKHFKKTLVGSDVILAIVGPTACGKTRRAVEIAREFNAEIVSGDSRQLYRGMDIGTGKDLEEYGNVPYHLIDICNPGEKYNLHRYIWDFDRIVSNISMRGKRSILCGGSGMYIESALSGVILPSVPENLELRKSLEGKSLSQLTSILKSMKSLHNITDVDTTKRAIRAIEIQVFYRSHPETAALADRNNVVKRRSVIIGLDIPREKRRMKISQRLEERLSNGMIDEVRTLIENGVAPDDLIYYGLEYKYLTMHVIGQLSYNEMKHQLEIAIHQFAKRQMTWFRGMERRGFKINWIPYDICHNELISYVTDLWKST